jgi:hypothetical protein
VVTEDLVHGDRQQDGGDLLVDEVNFLSFSSIYSIERETSSFTWFSFLCIYDVHNGNVHNDIAEWIEEKRATLFDFPIMFLFLQFLTGRKCYRSTQRVTFILLFTEPEDIVVNEASANCA